MDRRSFLKRLAAITVAAFGTPEETVQKIFATSGSKLLLKDAVKILAERKDAAGLLTLMSETYKVCQPDLRLASAGLSYYIFLGGPLSPVVKEARNRNKEPGPRELLNAFKTAFMYENGKFWHSSGGHHVLVIEAEIIAGMWNGDPKSMIVRSMPDGEKAFNEYAAAHDLGDLRKLSVQL